MARQILRIEGKTGYARGITCMRANTLP